MLVSAFGTAVAVCDMTFTSPGSPVLPQRVRQHWLPLRWRGAGKLQSFEFNRYKGNLSVTIK
jgi:hypothetical protein